MNKKVIGFIRLGRGNPIARLHIDNQFVDTLDVSTKGVNLTDWIENEYGCQIIDGYGEGDGYIWTVGLKS